MPPSTLRNTSNFGVPSHSIASDAFHTAMRSSDVPADVDTFASNRQMLTVAGAVPAFAPPKTRRSNRTAVVPSAVLDALASHMARYPLGPDGLLFTRDDGTPMRRDLLGSIWRTAAATVKVVGRSPHDLRHYAASVMIEQGASVKAVQQQLGHEKATTTLDTYAHLWPDSADITRRALDAGLQAVVSDSCPSVGGALGQAL